MIINNPADKVPPGSKRSEHWPKARADFLKLNPTCKLCGGNKKLEVHHIRPFHLHPELELDPKNFITLCEEKQDGANCHLLCGHLGNFKSYNTAVELDALDWNRKITHRPMGGEGA
jgi:5-methylcytosine-specific restriction enzyme A